ncbi:hypothetical protein HELRODRAFT_72173 [Helobdella robusta]|uniref:NADH dehydrogenase [ubiquinone] 1 alpha subcomplex subunit 12 n=1 Tax=Helobdella robusta TaxID=6412 RepID=T1G0W7_HELRO|nr:hypothetical protein HELRODRAFT_72173 [Helobdella robusta]ESO11060.1 hypothetical protein HELRODRAFT_72173 [Helobdella robusta]
MSLYLEKLRHLRYAIKQHGVFGSVLQLFRTDEIKWGTLVGQDKFGNKYYQNKLYFMGRSRWVYYSDKNFGWDYDGSQVPAEWHRWLHYITDEPPTKSDLVKYDWLAEHQENVTGQKSMYYPFSTTTPKIKAWKPGAK